MIKFTSEAQRKYLRIPFKEYGRDFKGCDCGGLVWLVYKTELGIELPDWRAFYSGTQISHKHELMSTVGTMLGENGVDVTGLPIQPFDVVAFLICGSPIHVGVAVNENYFLHIMEGKTNVALERFQSPQWNKRISGYFRHERFIKKPTASPFG